MTKPHLAGKRILVVEDEFILYLYICEQIEACGGVVVGPVTTLEGGHALFEDTDDREGGILNIRLGTEMVYPLADRLIAAGVPTIFASSEHRASVPDLFVNVPLIRKPVDMIAVAAHLFSPSDCGSFDSAADMRSGENADC